MDAVGASAWSGIARVKCLPSPSWHGGEHANSVFTGALSPVSEASTQRTISIADSRSPCSPRPCGTPSEAAAPTTTATSPSRRSKSRAGALRRWRLVARQRLERVATELGQQARRAALGLSSCVNAVSDIDGSVGRNDAVPPRRRLTWRRKAKQPPREESNDRSAARSSSPNATNPADVAMGFRCAARGATASLGAEERAEEVPMLWPPPAASASASAAAESATVDQLRAELCEAHRMIDAASTVLQHVSTLCNALLAVHDLPGDTRHLASVRIALECGLGITCGRR